MKSSLWSFANIASTVCVSDDAVRNPSPLSILAIDLTLYSRVKRSASHWKVAMLNRI